MRTIKVLTVILFVLITLVVIQVLNPVNQTALDKFQIRSIDTVKYSRDLALQMIEKPEFDTVIDSQVSLIAQTGANYVAISTPYDAKFLPFLTRWVSFARKHNLKVWFRGNFAGWEGWFSFSKINRSTHLKMMNQFILSNPYLFEDGDIFTPCPECENGGPGDPRDTKDVAGFQKFMIAEYQASKEGFRRINKEVITNFASANFDVASLVMDKPTTEALGGVVTIDHYVKDPLKLAQDVDTLAKNSGGKIVLGEFGAPIPDIHGKMTEDEQASWLDNALSALSSSENILGLNYWTSMGASTQLWNDDGSSRKAVEVLKKYYSAIKLS